VRSFLDTNLLVYADAGDEPAKQRIAIELIKLHRAGSTGVVSTQVLQEYVNVALRKLKLPHPLVRDRLAVFARFEIVPASADLISAALDLHAARGLAFYDALIVQAAVQSGCTQLLSEDLQAGLTLGGLTIVNPFADPGPPRRARVKR
jgi:predicted nucleic acid-binding protein